MLEIRGVTKVFRSDILSAPFVALDDVSFEIPSNTTVGFLGANGAGKTTSIKIILDFIRADKGTVTFAEGLYAASGKVRYEKIGYLPERPYFYPHLTGLEFACFMGELAGMTSSQVRSEVQKLAPRFGIDHALSRALKTYSKGMLQRIGFLVTILHSPELIILDEPLSGLDPVGRLEMKDIILDLRRAGKTVFFSSHIVPDVEEICDRVVFLRHGKLVYDGSVDRLLAQNSKQTYTVTIPAAAAPVQTPLLRRERLNPDVDKCEVRAEHKDQLVRELAAAQVSIQSLQQDRPNLEEIFYQIRS
ncbi:MAG: ABC transporter ATP-binding protein [Bacteriovoracia bacterium]